MGQGKNEISLTIYQSSLNWARQETNESLFSLKTFWFRMCWTNFDERIRPTLNDRIQKYFHNWHLTIIMNKYYVKMYWSITLINVQSVIKTMYKESKQYIWRLYWWKINVVGIISLISLATDVNRIQINLQNNSRKDM